MSISFTHDWQVDFGPVFGNAGTTTTITVAPQVAFQGRKVMANDTSPNPGQGVRVMSLLVGNKLQRPTSSGSTLAAFFGPAALGNDVRWDTCPATVSIAITVSFVDSCTFDMSVFGRAVS